MRECFLKRKCPKLSEIDGMDEILLFDYATDKKIGNQKPSEW